MAPHLVLYHEGCTVKKDPYYNNYTTYSCQSLSSAKAVHEAGGYSCITPTGWNPGLYLISSFLGVRASCPFHAKLSLSLTMLPVTGMILLLVSSRLNFNETICPAVPPMTRVSLRGHMRIF